MDSQDNISEMQLYRIMDRVYPIGTLYWNEKDGRDPRIILGFGKWTQIKDRFILSAGDTYSATAQGGAATHSHSLSDNAIALIRIALSSPYLHMRRVGSFPSWTATHQYTATGQSAAGDTSADTAGAALRGNTDTASSLPPYEVAYCWRRIA